MLVSIDAASKRDAATRSTPSATPAQGRRWCLPSTRSPQHVELSPVEQRSASVMVPSAVRLVVDRAVADLVHLHVDTSDTVHPHAPSREPPPTVRATRPWTPVR